MAACHSSSGEPEASLAPPAARTGGRWETLLGTVALPPGISATRVGRVLRDHLAAPDCGTLVEASMRECIHHHQPRLRAVHVQYYTAPRSSSPGAEAALLARAVVTLPGPGLGVLRTRRPTNIPRPRNHQMPEQRCPGQQDYMGTVDMVGTSDGQVQCHSSNRHLGQQTVGRLSV